MIRPLCDTEREQIEKALVLCPKDKAKAAAMLGISRSTLYRKLEEYRVQDAAAVKQPMRFYGVLDSQNRARELSGAQVKS